MDTIHTCSKCKSFYKIKETEDGNEYLYELTRINGRKIG